METINSYIPYLRGYDFTGKVPVIIDFYAAWCGPCKALSPIMEQLAEAYAGKIKVLKVDVDKNQALAQLQTFVLYQRCFSLTLTAI